MHVSRVLSLVLLLCPAALLAAPMTVKPNRDWVAVVANPKLKLAAPKNGLITDAKAFVQLWKAWRPDEKPPEIDFTKEFVLVTLAGGPNRPGIRATVEDGAMKVLAMQTLIGGPGFGYSLATFNRAGIQKVNGVPLPGR